MDHQNNLQRRRILLEIETAIAPGRDMLRGISKFVGEINRWDVHHNAGNWSLHGSISGPSHIEPLPADQSIDGVITRIYDDASRQRAHELIKQGIKVVDILGDHNDSSLHLVHTDDAAISKMALRHLNEQGFDRFAFMGIENTRWSIQRGKAFSSESDTPTPLPPGHGTNHPRQHPRNPHDHREATPTKSGIHRGCRGRTFRLRKPPTLHKNLQSSNRHHSCQIPP